jgi:hypothetical protein
MNCSPQSEKKHAASAIGRRDCLRIMTGMVIAAGCLPALRQLPSLQADLEHALRNFGASAIGDAASLRRLGALYLARHPPERDLTHLTRVLLGAHAMPEMSALFESVARDWRSHDVALLDGWLLARTEARVCALLHLMQGTAA